MKSMRHKKTRKGLAAVIGLHFALFLTPLYAEVSPLHVSKSTITVFSQKSEGLPRANFAFSGINGAYLDTLTSQFVSWAVQDEYKQTSLNLKDAWNKFKKKKDVVVAVIDTGIDYKHPFIKDNLYVVAKENAAKGDFFGVDFSKDAPSRFHPDDGHGHGTHIAGLIKSVMPDVKILPLKYYNQKASDSDNLKSTIEAIEYATAQGVDIINYSSGGPGASPEELRALRKAEEKGILVVAAAGNRSADIDQTINAYYPASYGLPNIITVMNHDMDGHIGPSSNYGKNKADISAPGTRIKSALPGDRAGYLTGTSQATAFVSGVAALIKAQFPDLTYEEIKKAIVASARPGMELRGKCLGEGMLDASRALDQAEKIVEMKKLQQKFAGL